MALRYQLAIITEDFGGIYTKNYEYLRRADIGNPSSKLFGKIAGEDDIIQPKELQKYLQETDSVPWVSKHPMLVSAGVMAGVGILNVLPMGFPAIVFPAVVGAVMGATGYVLHTKMNEYSQTEDLWARFFRSEGTLGKVLANAPN